MIQDIAPHKLNNQYDPAKQPADDSIILDIRNKSLLVRVLEEGFAFIKYSEFEKKPEVVHLFAVDDQDYFLVRGDVEKVPDECAYMTIDRLRKEHLMEKYQIFTAITAYQLSNWYEDNVFCGRCGSKTELSTVERAIRCPECGRLIYPRIIPAVIVGVTNGDKILMTKYANRGINFYALIAGFTEIGETFEETVEREVMEEVGLKVKNIRYYKSQPWGIVDDMLAGFYCDVDGDTSITLDTTELKKGVWVERENVELQPDDYSLTNEMMLMFKEGKEPKA